MASQPQIVDIIKYNEVDCRTVGEIIEFLRTRTVPGEDEGEGEEDDDSVVIARPKKKRNVEAELGVAKST